jgi:hypothetical protein
MAKIIDPDYLNQGTEIIFDATGKTIELVTAGNLSTDGVTLQAIYSFCKEEWKTTDLIKYPFPFVAITAEQFELVNGWNWKTTTSTQLIRDGGWALKDTNSVTQEEWMNLTTLGSFDDSNSDRAYYQQTSGQTGTDTVLTGEVNQAIQIYDNGNYDYKSYFKIFLREQGKLYDFYDLISDQNLSELTYKKYALPLSNNTDLKITHNDTIISGSTPYNGMSITYYSTAQPRLIGTTNYNFHIIIDGNNGTAEEIYEFVQYELRQNSDIDAGSGTVIGKVAEELLGFIGDTLRTKSTNNSSYGVYIDNFQAIDTNRLEFTDDTDTVRTHPYVAAGSIQFNDNLKNDTESYYWVFFTDASGNTFNSPNAIIINDKDGISISGSCSGIDSKTFNFDYDGNVQGGRTSGTDAPYTAVAIGLDTGQYVITTGTITRSTANVINYVAALERNYSNP